MRPACRAAARYIAIAVFLGTLMPIIGYATGAMHLTRWTTAPDAPAMALNTAILINAASIAIFLITLNGGPYGFVRAKDYEK